MKSSITKGILGTLTTLGHWEEKKASERDQPESWQEEDEPVETTTYCHYVDCKVVPTSKPCALANRRMYFGPLQGCQTCQLEWGVPWEVTQTARAENPGCSCPATLLPCCPSLAALSVGPRVI